MLELSFADTKLRGICESPSRAKKALGVDAARELKRVLADITAFSNVAELINLFSPDISERSPTELAIQMKSGVALVFCAGHVKVPCTSSGATAWAEVSRVKITALEATDG